MSAELHPERETGLADQDSYEALVDMELIEDEPGVDEDEQ